MELSATRLFDMRIRLPDDAPAALYGDNRKRTPDTHLINLVVNK